MAVAAGAGAVVASGSGIAVAGSEVSGSEVSGAEVGGTAVAGAAVAGADVASADVGVAASPQAAATITSTRKGSSVLQRRIFDWVLGFRFPFCLLGFGLAMENACWIRLPIFR